MTVPEDFRLRHALDLPLAEHVLLPSIEMTSCERFVAFPGDAECLIPVSMKRVTQRLPRVSLFSSNGRVALHGFRLFEAEGAFFTDASLVSAPEKSASQVQTWRAANRIVEDIDFSEIGSRDRLIPIERDGPILLPQSDEPSNFGSWIFRFLPKLMLAKNAGTRVGVLAYVKPGWTQALLELVGTECEIIPHNPVARYLISNPLIPSLAVPNVLFRPELLALMWGLIKGQDDGDLGEMIYVSRLGQAAKRPQHRNLENEQELVDRLELLGFREFRPENYSIAQQIAIFSKAKIIVGLGGSNMFGCIFARNAELVVDIESGSEWLFAHSNLFSSLPTHFSIVNGKRLATHTDTPHVTWTVDVDALIAGLAQLGVSHGYRPARISASNRPRP
jgi:hypothetical protein